MTRGELSATSILNAVAPRLRQVPLRATAFLLLTALPLRLLQVHFISLLFRLRGEAAEYGNLLFAVSTLVVAAFVVSIYGRAVFMQACAVPADSMRMLLRVNWKRFLTYLYVALIIEIALVLFSVTLIALPLAVMLAGVAAAASIDPPQPGVFAPLRAIARYLRSGRVLVALIFVFSIAYVVALINLAYFARLLLWMSGAIPGFDPVRWSAAFSHSNRFTLALLAGAATLVEPFFLTAIHVYAERVRARQSGDDLLFRFRALTSQKAIAAVVLLAFVAIPLRAQQITTADYVRSLRSIRDAYVAQQYPVARAGAQQLSGVQSIAGEGTTYQPDRALLKQVANQSATAKLDLVLASRLSATIDALAAGAAHNSVEPTDADLLQRIRNREKTGELTRGGTLKELPPVSPTIADEIERIFARVINWLAAKLEGLFDAIARLWPSTNDEDDDRARLLGVPVVVWIVTLLIVATLLLLAAYVLRRSKRRVTPVMSEDVATSARDADPLSREANEWERYASELAASGRLREAIRAWYHAVLVALYRAGILHYRKGVTNWEYVSALAPSLEWRPQFVSITREFDREWYGRHQTTDETLDAYAADARLILGAVAERR